MEPVQPPRAAYDEAEDHKIHTAAQISNNVASLKDSLAQNKPVIVSIAVYSEFMDDVAAATGNVSLPRRNSRVHGNHAVLVVGYDDYKRKWICRNSWGPRWGDRG